LVLRVELLGVEAEIERDILNQAEVDRRRRRNVRPLTKQDAGAEGKHVTDLLQNEP
jgi:hypothetical protein